MVENMTGQEIEFQGTCTKESEFWKSGSWENWEIRENHERDWGG
jgi:hypothetical protein